MGCQELRNNIGWGGQGRGPEKDLACFMALGLQEAVNNKHTDRFLPVALHVCSFPWVINHEQEYSCDIANSIELSCYLFLMFLFNFAHTCVSPPWARI